LYNRIAVVIPCLNEESTVAKVISDFRRLLPEAAVFVIDNNSTDSTARVASEAGAEVIAERQPGKGMAVRKAFRMIDADIYLLVDGDDTYPAEAAAALLAPILDDLADIVVGSRLCMESGSDFRLRNRLGNVFFRKTINTLFKARLTDILSGYRAMSRDFVKRMQILAKGFEIEAELTIMALNRGFRIVEVPVTLRSRPADSSSKIRVVRDGLRILGEIVSLFFYYKPLSFFGSLGLLLVVPAAASWLTGFPTLQGGAYNPVAAIGLGLTGVLSIGVGGILHVTTRRFQELDQRLDLLNDEIARPR
jgi:glycosyltransferase involved in cell wall biosynthesis